MLKTVAELMTGSIPHAYPTQTVGEILTSLRKTPSEEMGHLYLVDSQSHLIGQIPLDVLVTAPEDQRLENLAGSPPIQVHPEDAGETAALQAVTRHDSDVAVIDKEGHLLGAVPIGRLLALLHEEHVDNLLRMAGLGSSHPDPVETYRIIRAYRARISWLILGLFGGLAAGFVVGSFEQALQKELHIAFFLPLVVYMSDAIGTQTETFLIRKLAHGPVPLCNQLFNEGLIGAMLGISIGGVAAAGLLLLGMNLNIASVIGLTLFSTAIIASILASLIPIAFERLGADPAYASGPLATVLQDLLSVATYLLIATALI